MYISSSDVCSTPKQPTIHQTVTTSPPNGQATVNSASVSSSTQVTISATAIELHKLEAENQQQSSPIQPTDQHTATIAERWNTFSGRLGVMAEKWTEELADCDKHYSSTTLPTANALCRFGSHVRYGSWALVGGSGHFLEKALGIDSTPPCRFDYTASCKASDDAFDMQNQHDYDYDNNDDDEYSVWTNSFWTDIFRDNANDFWASGDDGDSSYSFWTNDE